MHHRLIEIWKTGPTSIAVFIRGDSKLGQKIGRKLNLKSAYVVGANGKYQYYLNISKLEKIKDVLGISSLLFDKFISMPWTYLKMLSKIKNRKFEITRLS